MTANEGLYFGPGVPGVPGTPASPFGPCGPRSPCGPCGPWAPCGPCGPATPRGPGRAVPPRFVIETRNFELRSRSWSDPSLTWWLVTAFFLICLPEISLAAGPATAEPVRPAIRATMETTIAGDGR